MLFGSVPCRRSRFVGARVLAGFARKVIAPQAALPTHSAVSAEVQTKFQAAAVESASPVKRMVSAKVMPLDGDPDFVHIAVQRTPAVFQLTPGMLFGCATRVHRA